MARLAAYVAAIGWLVYAGEKVYMAAIGKIGMPGHLAPESVQARYDHASLAQVGNSALGIVVAAIALATVHRWARRIPAVPMLAVLVGASVPAVAGMVIMFARLPDNSGGSMWQVGLEGVAIGLQGLPWLLVVATFCWRTRMALDAMAAARHRVVT